MNSATIEMTGARKAALLLVSLGQERAARIVQSLNETKSSRSWPRSPTSARSTRLSSTRS